MKQIKLLIADDHQLMLEGIISLLKGEKDFAAPDIAANGFEVLKLADKNDYDVCLLDINMPELDGIKTASMLHQRRQDIKIIILTTYDDKEIVAEIMQAGISGYVLKNSSKQELITAIRKVAEGGMYFSDDVHKTIINSYTNQLAKKKQADRIDFTSRELEILQLLAREYTNEKIATALNISYRTVETHRKNMLQKTGSHNLAGLLKFAYGKGFIQ